MKKLLFLILLLPMFASAQLDFESNKYKLDFVKLPKVESLLTYSLTSDANFLTKYSNKLPSFKMNKENYRQPVNMFEAVANTQSYTKSDIQISIDPREYGVYGGNSTYSADSSTEVKNTVYKDVSQPFLFTNPYQYRRRSGFGIYAGYSPYRGNRGY
jgi:hypothetical protein